MIQEPERVEIMEKKGRQTGCVGVTFMCVHSGTEHLSKPDTVLGTWPVGLLIPSPLKATHFTGECRIKYQTRWKRQAYKQITAALCDKYNKNYASYCLFFKECKIYECISHV